MEKRRGESSDAWMKKSGESGFITEQEAYDAADRVRKECDAAGIDPTLSLPERVARLQDIHQGSPLMQEERQRKEYNYETNKL